jgi:hypothetical protein
VVQDVQSADGAIVKTRKAINVEEDIDVHKASCQSTLLHSTASAQRWPKEIHIKCCQEISQTQDRRTDKKTVGQISRIEIGESINERSSSQENTRSIQHSESDQHPQSQSKACSDFVQL